MNRNYAQEFKEYLQNECKYPSDSVFVKRNCKIRDLICDKVEVKADGMVIQAFAVLSDSQRKSHHVFPFYHDYEAQKADRRISIRPSCSIATFYQQDGWKVFDASDSRSERNIASYLNYKLASDRFISRWNSAPGIVVVKRVKKYSILCAIFLAIYLIAHIVVQNLTSGAAYLPFNSEVLICIISIVLLLALPVIIPFIKALKIFGVEIYLDD